MTPTKAALGVRFLWNWELGRKVNKKKENSFCLCVERLAVLFINCGSKEVSVPSGWMRLWNNHTAQSQERNKSKTWTWKGEDSFSVSVSQHEKGTHCDLFNPQNPLGTSGDTAVEFLLSPQRAILDLRLIHDGLFISVAPGDLFAFRAGRWAWKKKKKKAILKASHARTIWAAWKKKNRSLWCGHLPIRWKPRDLNRRLWNYSGV